MAATQIERVVQTCYDGKKLVFVNVANPGFVSGYVDITVNSVSEIVEVYGPTFGFVNIVSGQTTATSGNLMATAQVSGFVFEYTASKSPLTTSGASYQKNGIRVVAFGTNLAVASGTTTWSVPTPTQMSGTTMNFLVTGI